MDLEIKIRRIVDSITKRCDAGEDLRGRPRTITDSQIRNARHLIERGETTAHFARDLGMSGVTLYRRERALSSVPDRVAPGDTRTIEDAIQRS